MSKNLHGLEAVCTSNIIKYAIRWKKKNGLEDVRKIKKYAEILIDYLEGNFDKKYGLGSIRNVHKDIEKEQIEKLVGTCCCETCKPKE